MDSTLFQSLCYHNYSCDKNTRPYAHYELPPLSCNDLFNQTSKHDFYCMCGFWPEQFKEITDAMALIPDAIIHNKTGVKCEKKLAFF